jgi:putative Mg2+ transporter-C (MgtC) family protein
MLLNSRPARLTNLPPYQADPVIFVAMVFGERRVSRQAAAMDAIGFNDAALATLLAALLGAAIGAEREWRRHPGGLRSCALVSAAACAFAHLAVAYGGTNPGAGLGAIASGVGFLGAGVILHAQGHVRGLSTAATFWAVAAIGTAAGVLEYQGAVVLTLVVFFAHVVLRPLSAWIDRAAPPEDQGPR